MQQMAGADQLFLPSSSSMSLSWHKLGLCCKAAYLLMPCAAALGIWAVLAPANDLIAVVAGLAAVVIGRLGLFGAGVALLYFIGWLTITCPICAEPSQLVGNGNYTYLQCPRCGDVHARGFLRSKYSAEKS